MPAPARAIPQPAALPRTVSPLTPAAPRTAPTTIAPPAPAITAPIVAAPGTTTATPQQSAPTLLAPPINTLGHDSAGNARVDTRAPVRGGAPMAPSGVTMAHTPLTMAQRDSMLRGVLGNIPELARKIGRAHV